MKTIVRAIYENGVFRPIEPVTAKEGIEVEVAVPGERPQPTPEEVYRRIRAIATLPRESDLEPDPHVSRDHDKYLYGRPE